MECVSCGKETETDERICRACRGATQSSESAKYENVTNPKRSVTFASKSGDSVVVTDIQMPFGSMVIFMIKWAIASIPAAIILGIIWLITVGILGGIFGGIFI